MELGPETLSQLQSHIWDSEHSTTAPLQICAYPNAMVACVCLRNKRGKTKQLKTEGAVSPNSKIYWNASSADLSI